MSIKILRPGLVTTLVDEGRTGFRSIGIGPGGAMDLFAMSVANYLVGNDKRSATLEIHFPGPEILFQQTHILAVTGMGFEPRIDDQVVPLWTPFKIEKDSILRFGKKTRGSRAYLAVHGGWNAQEWLGSFSTHSGVQAGGYRGRALQKNDILEAGINKVEVEKEKDLPGGIPPHELNRIYSAPHEIRCIASAETDLLSPSSENEMFTSSFIIHRQSNRMGYRLEGVSLFLRQSVELISSPVDFGTIQLLPDGNLIVLMADHQTTGGYPRIASVSQVDLPKLAQLNPGEKINFKMISFFEAESELLSREKHLAELRHTYLIHFKKLLYRDSTFD